MRAYSILVYVVCLWISRSSAEKAKRVNVTLYFESLCPGCQNFINTQFYPAFESIGSIMNVALVPYGNAFEEMDEGKWKYTCQHGKQECVGNLIETCAIHYYPKPSLFFPFVHCIESSGKAPNKVASLCARRFKLNYSKILSCAKGDLGNRLEHQMALKTKALSPKHEYVPWVTINGVHTEKIENEAENNLVKLVCKTYEGCSKPDTCKKYENKAIQRCLKNPEKIHLTKENKITNIKY